MTVSNAEVRRATGCSPLSHLVTNRRLRLVGHIAHSSPREDNHRAVAGHYSRRMATYCGYSNAPADYALKEEKKNPNPNPNPNPKLEVHSVECIYLR